MLSEEDIELFHSTIRPLVTGQNTCGELKENADIFVKIAYSGYMQRGENQLRKTRRRRRLTFVDDTVESGSRVGG